MNNRPFVSVIMPAYNNRQYIQDAIESILHQTYTSFECIIVDDHSTDGTQTIIRDYATRFSPFVKALFLKKHAGDAACANKAFRLAKGTFIARMDADDMAHPRRLEKQIAYLLQHPQIFVLGTQGYVIDSKNTIIGEKKFPLTDLEIYKKFSMYNPMLHPSCIFRRSLLPNRHLLYEANTNIHNDYYTFFSYLRFGAFANLPDKLLYYRMHGKNSSLKNPKKRFAAIQKIRFYAASSLSYKMTFTDKLHNLLQTLIIMLIPEKVIVPLYLYLRGMYSPFYTLKRFTFPTQQISFSTKS